ncbi:MAG: Flp pilus assembly complex ATPase component TadA [Burkholderiales bacterium]|nr:Flp pilus assembly complex ATPase component TadA [Burkholderiales bacterium]
MFTINVTTAKGESSNHPLQGNVATIGKADDNAVQLKGWTIGKRHASVVIRDGKPYLDDHGGLSVTEVNGKAVDETYGPLKDSDVIQIGGYEIRVVGSNGAAAAPRSVSDGDIAAAQPATPSIEDMLSATLSRPIPAYSPKPLSPTQALPTAGSAPAPAPAVARAPVAEATPGGVNHARPPVLKEQRVDAPAAAAEPAFDPNMTMRTMARVQADERVVRMNRARQMVHAKLISMMDLRRVDVSRMEEAELRSTTSALVGEIIAEARDLPAGVDRDMLTKQVIDEVVGLGPLEDLLADDKVTEIMVNRYDEIFIERGGKLTESEITFTSDNAVLQAIERIVAPLGRRIDESSPMVDARLKDGSRVNAVIPPLALKGCNITIRKFAKNKLQADDLVKFGSVTHDMMAFLKVAVEQGTNIIISGGTGSGKTTLLNVLSNFIPDDERIVTVEDAAELKLSQPNLVSLEARPPNVEGKGAVHIRDLVKNCLRMRPDRIVVGECRGGEALDMLQAMNTGHDGSLTTAHANTPRDCIARLEVMVLMSGLDLPIQAIREQISSAVHLFVQQNRFPDGSRRVTHITEVTGIEGGVIQTQDIFLFKQAGYGPDGRIKGSFFATGAIPELYQSLAERGIPVDLSIFQKDREL